MAKTIKCPRMSVCRVGKVSTKFLARGRRWLLKLSTVTAHKVFFTSALLPQLMPQIMNVIRLLDTRQKCSRRVWIETKYATVELSQSAEIFQFFFFWILKVGALRNPFRLPAWISRYLSELLVRLLVLHFLCLFVVVCSLIDPIDSVVYSSLQKFLFVYVAMYIMYIVPPSGVVNDP